MTLPLAGKRRRRAPSGAADRVIGYVRVSTDDQELGPEAQRQRLVEWCERESAELIVVFEDVGVSGGAELDRRPGLLAAIEAVRAHRAGVLLAAKRDRLARDTMLAAIIDRLAERNGARVRTADGVADGDTPEAQLLRAMLDAFAQYERMLIATRTKAALAVKSARRQRTGGIPFGFRVEQDGVHLVEDEGEQATIATLLELREGRSLRALAQHCKEHRIPARKADWSPVTLSRLFRRLNGDQGAR